MVGWPDLKRRRARPAGDYGPTGAHSPRGSIGDNIAVALKCDRETPCSVARRDRSAKAYRAREDSPKAS